VLRVVTPVAAATTCAAGSSGPFGTACSGLSVTGSADTAGASGRTNAARSADSTYPAWFADTACSADSTYPADTADASNAPDPAHTAHTPDASNTSGTTHEVIVVVHVDVGGSPSTTVTPAAAHPRTHHESEAE
jgi:hypothetical protein